MDDVDALARATFVRAGLDVSEEDLSFVKLVYGGLLDQLARLDEADVEHFPFEPVDPSRPPEPR